MYQEVKLHKILTALVAAHKISIMSLSRELKIPRSTLNTYMYSAKASYSPQHLLALSHYFKMPIDYLLFGTSPETASKILRYEGQYEIILRRL